MASQIRLNSVLGKVVIGVPFGGEITSQPGTGNGALFMEYAPSALGPWLTARAEGGGGTVTYAPHQWDGYGGSTPIQEDVKVHVLGPIYVRGAIYTGIDGGGPGHPLIEATNAQLLECVAAASGPIFKSVHDESRPRATHEEGDVQASSDSGPVTATIDGGSKLALHDEGDMKAATGSGDVQAEYDEGSKEATHAEGEVRASSDSESVVTTHDEDSKTTVHESGSKDATLPGD